VEEVEDGGERVAPWGGEESKVCQCVCEERRKGGEGTEWVSFVARGAKSEEGKRGKKQERLKTEWRQGSWEQCKLVRS